MMVLIVMIMIIVTVVVKVSIVLTVAIAIIVTIEMPATILTIVVCNNSDKSHNSSNSNNTLCNFPWLAIKTAILNHCCKFLQAVLVSEGRGEMCSMAPRCGTKAEESLCNEDSHLANVYKPACSLNRSC